jgi:hypothetical protein
MGATANSFPFAAAGFAAVFMRGGLARGDDEAQLEKACIGGIRHLSVTADLDTYVLLFHHDLTTSPSASWSLRDTVKASVQANLSVHCPAVA